MKVNIYNLKSCLFNLLILFLFLSNNSVFSLSIIFVLFIFFCIMYGTINMSVTKTLILTSFILAFILNVYTIELKSIIRLIEFFIAFMYFPLNLRNIKISTKLLHFIIIFIFIFFIGNLLGIPFFQNLIIKLYPADGNSWEILYNGTAEYSGTITDILNQRLASIYYNPNLLGQNLTLLLTIYLVYKYFHKFTKIDFLLLSILLLMIIGSGSRTAFIVILVILFFYLKQFTNRNLFFKLIVPTIILIIVFIAINTRLLLIFNQSNTSMDSMGIKHDLVFEYFDSFNFNNILNYIFGFLSFNTQFDYDIGDYLFNFGIFGLFTIILFLCNEFFLTPKKYKYFYTFLLISYGATLIINFKYFILTILILSLIKDILRNNNLSNIKKIIT